jgi:hypothetical protein
VTAFPLGVNGLLISSLVAQECLSVDHVPTQQGPFNQDNVRANVSIRMSFRFQGRTFRSVPDDEMKKVVLHVTSSGKPSVQLGNLISVERLNGAPKNLPLGRFACRRTGATLGGVSGN